MLFIILLLLALLLIASVVVLFYFAWSAKTTLSKGQTSWSAKSIPIKRNKFIPKTKKNSSLLEVISNQTSEYLESKEDTSEVK